MRLFCAQCEGPIEGHETVSCPRCGAAKPPFGWPRDPLLGSAVDEGRFEILQRLGSGGFGVVYEVKTRLGSFHRAMKVLGREQATRADLQRRFMDEARALDSLDHPNIVRCYGIGLLQETGQPYILLELLQGQTLKHRVWPDGTEACHPIEPLEALEIGIQVAGALEAAHQEGMLHRDLKPGNIMLLERDGAPHIKVIDFGIARILKTNTVDRQTSRLLGTPEYMAPEQFQPGMTLNPRLDLWQLGAVLFFMLTGRPPYTSGRDTTTDPFAVYQQQRARDKEPGPLPSEHNPSLRKHPRLDHFVARLLSTDPERRPKDASAAREELEELRNTHNLPPQELTSNLWVAPNHPTSPDTPEWKPSPKRRMWALAGVFVALALGAVAFKVLLRPDPCEYTIIGQREVHSGEPVSLRASAYHTHKRHTLLGKELKVSFLQNGEEKEVWSGESSDSKFTDLNLTVPDAEPGEAFWKLTWHLLHVEHSVEIPVTVLPPMSPNPEAPWEVRQKWLETRVAPGVARDEGPIRIELFPEGGSTVNGLRSRLFVRTTDRKTGQPVSARVKLELMNGLLEGEAPREVTTDRGGLAWFSVIPVQEQRWRLTTHTEPPAEEHNPLEITTGGIGDALQVPSPNEPELKPIVLAEPPMSVQEILLPSKAAQFSLVVHDPVWDEGDQLQGAVLSLQREGPLYTDVYLGDRWQHTLTSELGPRGGGFSVAQRTVLRPTNGVWLVRLQTYANALHPGNAGDSRYIALPAPNLSQRDVLRYLLRQAIAHKSYAQIAEQVLESQWLRDADIERIQGHIAFWLSLFPSELEQPLRLTAENS